MSGWELTLIRPYHHDLDGASLTTLVNGADERSINEIALVSSKPDNTVSIRDLFQVRRRSDENIVIDGDVSFLHCVGFGWSTRTLIVTGNVGCGFGTSMRGGKIEVHGSAGDSAACQLRGGLINVKGNVGNYLGGPLPGRRSGMSGGRVVIAGDAGHHAGHRMRRGTVVVLGNCGDGVASDMVAGTIAVNGQVGDFVAAGMKRGTLILNQPATMDPVRFTLGHHADLGIARLIANDLLIHSPDIASRLRRPFQRRLGDRSANGMGEIWSFTA
jgi:formylmethanofuran dehydrogenase subunit C